MAALSIGRIFTRATAVVVEAAVDSLFIGLTVVRGSAFCFGDGLFFLSVTTILFLCFFYLVGPAGLEPAAKGL